MRQERLAAQQAAASSGQRRVYMGYAAAGLIVAAIIAGIVVVISSGGGDGRDGVDAEGNPFPELAFVEFEIGAVPDGIKLDGRDGTDPPPLAQGDLQEAAEAADCELMLDLEDEGNQHLNNEDVPNVEYETNPPTSGDHYAGNETGSGALAGGAYLDYPPVGRIVHSMEHGRVMIQYSPDLSEAEQLELKGVFEESPEAVAIFPNPNMPYEVAVTAWTQLVGCDTYEGAKTLDVIRDFRDIYRLRGPENVPAQA
ncbi:hypothetical protein BH24ACT23_BH24ACT23_03530 [soil metagenome]